LGKSIKKHKKIKCNVCGKVGGEGTLKRYHFDNCKCKKFSEV